MCSTGQTKGAAILGSFSYYVIVLSPCLQVIVVLWWSESECSIERNPTLFLQMQMQTTADLNQNPHWQRLLPPAPPPFSSPPSATSTVVVTLRLVSIQMPIQSPSLPPHPSFVVVVAKSAKNSSTGPG